MMGVMGSLEPALVVPVLGNLLLKPGASNVENKGTTHFPYLNETLGVTIPTI